MWLSFTTGHTALISSGQSLSKAELPLLCVVVDCFYIALLSTLRQTYCALVAFDSKRVTVAFFMAHFANPLKRCIYSTVWLLHGWYHISVCAVYTIQPCTVSCHFLQSHTHRVHACLALTCPFGRMTDIL